MEYVFARKTEWKTEWKNVQNNFRQMPVPYVAL